MTDPAIIVRFKMKTLSLIDTMGLQPGDVVALGTTLAVAFGSQVGLSRDQLHDLLDASIIKAPTIPGAADAVDGAARNRAEGRK